MSQLHRTAFAEIVFDRPLTQGYWYAIPVALESEIAVGKRVEVPLGKGNRPTIGFCVSIASTLPTIDAEMIKPIRRILDDEPLFTERLLRLTRWMADYYLCGWGQVLNAVVPSAAKAKAGLKRTVLLELLDNDGELKLTSKQQAVVDYLRQCAAPRAMQQVITECGTGATVIANLVKKGILARREEYVEAGATAESSRREASDADIRLNADQSRALAPILEAIDSGQFTSFLLFGVTGSGKTELYLRAIQRVVERGDQALVLVPEISLTPQTIARFEGRFGPVAVLHSHLSGPERARHWRRIRRGEVQVIVGARSAVFAPAEKLGLIVIDEEHENTFKQETTPRYHARDVAVMRARMESIPILLGSATPSLESWHNARRGQYRLLTLPRRVLDRPLPLVKAIDLRYELRRGRRATGISVPLENAIRAALSDGGQVMLLLNRRGFAPFIHCLGCGYVARCKYCEVALTYHRQRHCNQCHLCGYRVEPEKTCPECRKRNLSYFGLGTEKLESELESLFPNRTIRRMDSDTMRKPGAHRNLLEAFRRGEVDVLLGTQMIAKGLDFPNVTLVGVINADTGLHLPDFRAAERTFQLLAQVAGRTGRGERGGRVLIQTFSPDHPAVALAMRHDYRAFAERELRGRKEHGYPPFERLIRIIVRGKDATKAEKAVERFAEAISSALDEEARELGKPASVRMLGPAEAPVFRIQGYYRFHMQLHSADSGLLHRVVRRAAGAVRMPAGTEYAIDVDPLSML